MKDVIKLLSAIVVALLILWIGIALASRKTCEDHLHTPLDEVPKHCFKEWQNEPTKMQGL